VSKASGGRGRIRKRWASGAETPIHPNYLAHVASKVLSDDTVVVSENFRAADHLMPFGFDKGQWRSICTYGGLLGYGIGAAIGAQLGAPDRPVVCSLGDGRDAARQASDHGAHSLPILTIVWNNLNYQTVRTNFAAWGGEMVKQNKYPEVYLGDPEIDFCHAGQISGRQRRQGDVAHELERASNVASKPRLAASRMCSMCASHPSGRWGGS
jgi:thiamine pyrophosphate-dependent acetolactate synthase large subunit-like protein